MFMTALSIVLFVLARIAAAGLSPTADAEILLAGDTVTGDAAEEMRMLEKQQDSPLLFTLWEEEKTHWWKIQRGTGRKMYPFFC